MTTTADAPSATTSVLGGTVRRREDPALIRGTGRYVDDITHHGFAILPEFLDSETITLLTCPSSDGRCLRKNLSAL